MSENITPSGNESLTVDQAASSLLGMMNAEEASQEQTESHESDQVEAQAEESYEESYESEDSEEVEQEQEQPRYRVKVDGQEYDVTQDELVKGYQREADYTKKTQTLAEQRKAVEAEKGAVEQAKQLRDTYAQRLQIIEQALRSQTPSEDLDALKEVDPIGYAVRVAEKSEKEKQLYAIRSEQARIAQMQQSEQAQHLQQVVAGEAEKLTKFLPEYADPEKGEQVRTNIKRYAESVGFSSDELSKVYDSRAVLTLYKAMQYDKLMSNKGEVTKKVGQAPKMVKAGVGKPIGSLEAEQTKRMKQQLRSSGKVSDAAKLFEKYF
jgi:hypothetical protein